MKQSIASVTTVCNSARQLPGQLAALRSQTRSLDEVIVVDNASTDSTRELLRESHPNVKVLSLSTNTGVGGAFSAGLEYAIQERGHDWVWLLDDDSIPQPDALEQLLRGLGKIRRPEEIAVLASRSVHEGTGLAYPGLLWHHGWSDPPERQLDEEICYVDAVISSGSLMSGEAVQRAGLPRVDFFMDFVDFEHCLRFRRAGYRIAVVRDSLMEHSNGNPRMVRMFGYSHPWADHAPWREYFACRNQVYTIWNYYPDWKSKLSTVRRLSRHALGILLLGREKRACLRNMYRGFLEGRAGKLGFREPRELGLGTPSGDGAA